MEKLGKLALIACRVSGCIWPKFSEKFVCTRCQVLHVLVHVTGMDLCTYLARASGVVSTRTRAHTGTCGNLIDCPNLPSFQPSNMPSGTNKQVKQDGVSALPQQICTRRANFSVFGILPAHAHCHTPTHAHNMEDRVLTSRQIAWEFTSLQCSLACPLGTAPVPMSSRKAHQLRRNDDDGQATIESAIPSRRVLLVRSQTRVMCHGLLHW